MNLFLFNSHQPNICLSLGVVARSPQPADHTQFFLLRRILYFECSLTSVQSLYILATLSILQVDWQLAPRTWMGRSPIDCGSTRSNLVQFSLHLSMAARWAGASPRQLFTSCALSSQQSSWPRNKLIATACVVCYPWPFAVNVDVLWSSPWDQNYYCNTSWCRPSLDFTLPRSRALWCVHVGVQPISGALFLATWRVMPQWRDSSFVYMQRNLLAGECSSML